MTRSIVKIILLFPTMLIAQYSLQVDSFPVKHDSLTQVFFLTKNFIQATSLKLSADSVTIQQFQYHKTTNSVIVTFDTIYSPHSTLFIHYRFLPLTLAQSYSLRSLVFKPDSVHAGKNKLTVVQQEGTFSNIFGPELTKSGSISRGFLVGSNRDLTLSSGFRLQMAGKLSNDIEILAALTDENTPIQPQGNTQTLQEVDNVFVEIKSPTYIATLGDFQFISGGSEFASINRKLQGARINADYQTFTPQSQATVTAATSRGKFHTNQFQGIEGVQGPYRLNGKNNERNIIIIAGSEKVFVDGVEMVRGDNNDYSIDYGSAEITFSTRRLITGASRIVVDFEYSDRQFTRNFAGVGTSTKLSDAIALRVQYYREGDDPDSPIDISLTDSDKEILKQSGNATASKSGVVMVGRDSLGIGKGNYIAIDTTISNQPFRYYQFLQGDTNSLYNIAFSSVGTGNGDYLREGLGRYRFVGIKKGQYLPIIILPSAQLHQLYAIQSTVSPVKDLIFDGEFAASNFDQNRFSPLGDNTNDGKGVKLSAKYSPKNVTLGNVTIGSFDVYLYERYREKTFFSFDRANEVEFGRKWSTDSLLTTTQATEEIREGKFTYSPVNDISILTGIGTLEREKEFSSVRYEAGLNFKKEKFPSLQYYAEQIEGREKISHLRNMWLRQKGSVEYTISSFTPSLRFEEENREVQDTMLDSLTSSSYAFVLYAPKLTASEFYGFDGSTEFEWRNDHALNNGEIVPQASSLTQNYTVALKEVQNFSASSSLTFRQKKYERAFQATNINQQTTLIKLQSRYRPYSQGIDLDLLYDAATQRTAKLERIFYKVRKGEGQYVWVDSDNDGIVDVNDEREFRLDRYDGEYNALIINSDNLIPIINLKVSSRLRIAPYRIIKQPYLFIEKIATALSTETFLRIEERSTESDINQIYLLNLKRFLRQTTTQYGFQFIQQDVHLFENKPEYSFRLRFNQRKGLSQYSSGVEKNYTRERSFRSRFQISNDVANQTDIIIKNYNAISSSFINQQRQISSSALVTDFSYRPQQNLEIGFKIETSASEDRILPQLVTANFNGQTVRTVLALQGNGQVRIEFSREEIILSNKPTTYLIPYELTGGRDSGKQYLWSATSDYKLGGNVQFSLQYSGRTTSRSTVVHNGRMEVRAYF
jgi:hypothetical protein